MSGLTNKQRAFIEHYLQCWNGTEAARRAGYQGNDNTLSTVGSENLRKPNIRKEIESRLSSEAMSANEVLWRLAEQARADLSDFVTLVSPDPEDEDEDTPAERLDLQKARAAGKLHLIKKLKYDRNGRLSIELHDQQSALSLLGKHLGLFRESFDHTVTVFNVEEWEARRRERLGQVDDIPGPPDEGEAQDA